MSAPLTSGLSVELLLRVIDVKYGCFTLLYFTLCNVYFILDSLIAPNITPAMLVERTNSEEVFWKFDSIIMKN